jgi:DUF1009 family protein
MTDVLGIIAGRGDLPVTLAERASAGGRPLFIIQLKGFEEPRLDRHPGEVMGLGQLGAVFNALRREKCTEVVFAGHVSRPSFADLKLDTRGAALLPKVIAAARKGDDALLRVLVGEFEQQGFKIIGSDHPLFGIVAPPGLIAGPEPSEGSLADIELGARIAAHLGALDIGQGCVVCDGLVLAVEAQEGTDEMLRRCAGLLPEIRGTPGARRGVLVKRPKPQQERRIDLPASGPQTIALAAEAGLSGVALEAGGALLLERDEMQRLASGLGLFIFGFDPALGQE